MAVHRVEMFLRRKKPEGLRGPGLILLSGLLHILLFPPFHSSFLAWIALVPFFLALERRRPLPSFLAGMAFGMVSFLGILHWLYPVVTGYFQRPPLFGAVFFLLGILLPAGVFYGLLALSCSCIHRQAPKISWLAIPSLWVTVEWLRSHPWTGIPPWELLGHSQYRLLPLIQISDLTGVYGISFGIVAVNVLLARIVIRFLEGERFERSEAIGPPFIFAAALLSVFLLYGYHKIKSFESPQPEETIHVSVIQGNIENQYRWKNIYYGRNLGKYLELTRQGLKENTDLIIWPENSINFYLERESYYLSLIKDLIGPADVYLVLGAPRYEEREGNKKAFYNSSYLISPREGVLGTYDKTRLLPLAETNPFEGVVSYGDAPGFPAQFSPGDRLSVFEIPQGKFSVAICYEIIYPDLIRKFVQGGARFLINLSNDSWLGAGPGPHQHLSMAPFRAVENRIYLVRATSTGISALIDPWGRIVRASSLFEDAILTGEIGLGGGGTFYARWGDLFAYACMLIALASLIVSWSKRSFS